MPEIATGARCKFSMAGVKVGYATGVSVREAITYEPIKVLDNIQVIEHVPVDYDVSMTADMIRIVGETIKSQGWFPQQGQSPAQHLLNMLNQGELVGTIEDSKTGKVIAHVEGVKLAERNLQVNARGVIGTNVSMVAKRARDESDIT